MDDWRLAFCERHLALAVRDLRQRQDSLAQWRRIDRASYPTSYDVLAFWERQVCRSMDTLWFWQEWVRNCRLLANISPHAFPR